MPRPAGAQIIRDRRKNGSVTFGLRVRAGGADERVPLGNSQDGWDEIRVEAARRQLMAKIELGVWTPGRNTAIEAQDGAEQTFREMATDWLEDRKRNPAIRGSTISNNEWQLTRYLLPFFGELRPSEITKLKIRQYRRQIHVENEEIRHASEAGRPLRDPRSAQRLRTLGNDSINKTIGTLAMILDEAEDADWIERNIARNRRMREPRDPRAIRGVLDVSEALSLLEAADDLECQRHAPATLERAVQVRALRDDAQLKWKDVADRTGVAISTAIYLYNCLDDHTEPSSGVRRAIIATLQLAGPRVSELCALNAEDFDLGASRFHVDRSKTPTGARTVDIHPRLLDELKLYRSRRGPSGLDSPEFPTRNGTRREKDNVRKNVIAPVVAHANTLRLARGENRIRAHVTPHTFRRTYITFMVAAGYDIPYVQAQVGHKDPTTTLAIYAQVMRRPGRDQLRAEIRALLGVAPQPPEPPAATVRRVDQGRRIASIEALRAAEKAAQPGDDLRAPAPATAKPPALQGTS
jgi:integrase